MEPYKKVLLAMGGLILIILIGTFGLYFIEGYTIIDALSITLGLITTTSIGYGTTVPLSVTGKIFTLALIILGISFVAYSFGTLVSLVLEGQLKNMVGRSKMKKRIGALTNHIILCGAGRVGRHVVMRLQKEGVPFVVIDQNEEIAQKLALEGCLVINDDATKDEVLIEAGISRAKGLITALPEDAHNVFVTLSCKQLNPDLTVVARADMPESEPKLKLAGADKVVTPALSGAKRMAISILKPISVDFVETLIHEKEVEFELEELLISDKSPLAGKELKHSGIKKETGSMVIAIMRNGTMIPNPGAEDLIQVGDLLIALGTGEQLRRLEKLASIV